MGAGIAEERTRTNVDAASQSAHPMQTLALTILDATGSRSQTVEVPADAPVARFIAVLVDRMRFPRNGPDGQLLSYKLQHRSTGRQLLDSQTLAQAGVNDGDALRLMPEITAGGTR